MTFFHLASNNYVSKLDGRSNWHKWHTIRLDVHGKRQKQKTIRLSHCNIWLTSNNTSKHLYFVVIMPGRQLSRSFAKSEWSAFPNAFDCIRWLCHKRWWLVSHRTIDSRCAAWVFILELQFDVNCSAGTMENPHRNQSTTPPLRWMCAPAIKSKYVQNAFSLSSALFCMHFWHVIEWFSYFCVVTIFSHQKAIWIHTRFPFIIFENRRLEIQRLLNTPVTCSKLDIVEHLSNASQLPNRMVNGPSNPTQSHIQLPFSKYTSRRFGEI